MSNLFGIRFKIAIFKGLISCVHALSLSITNTFSSSKAATPEEEKSKNDQKNFDILKYDGVRAQKIGQVAYAIKCFTEALKLQEDFETMTYLVAAYTTANKAEEAQMQKIYGYLGRKGFRYDTVRQVIQNYNDDA